MLQSDLARQGQDLSIDTNLVYFDVINRRLAVNTTIANNTLTVNGNTSSNYYFGVIGTANQPFITNIGTLGNLTVTGNITVGNVVIDGATANNISITGNITTTNGNISANTGRVSSNSLLTNTATIGNATITSTANLGNIVIANVTVTTNLVNGNINLSPTGNGIVKINGTNAFSIPSGNTAQQPGYVPVGSLRYNTELVTPEFYTGSTWVPVTSQISGQTITPNGSANAFSLTQSTTSAGVLVTLNGVMQRPDVAYTVSGNVITFVETPLTTDIIDIRYVAPGASTGLRLVPTPPASSTASGTSGDVAYNGSFIYFCVAPNTWIRANIQSSF